MKIEWKKYIPYGLCVLGGLIAGAYLDSHIPRPPTILEDKPVEIFPKELNDDDNQDFIIKGSRGTRHVFLGQEDGTFRSLEDIEKEQVGEIKENLDEIRTKAVLSEDI